MKNFKNIKQIVKELLQQDVTYADDLKRLCWAVWEKECENTFCNISYVKYRQMSSEGTIDRAKRSIERFHPELRGLTYNIRKGIREPEVREQMSDDKWEEIGEINRLV